MALKFVFEYASSSDVFVYLLRFYAQGFHYFLSQNETQITLKIRGDEKELLRFCTILEKIGNSIFLKAFDVSACEDNFILSPKDNTPFIKNDFLTHLNSSAYLENKALIENEWGVFLNLSLGFDAQNLEMINKQNFNSFLQKALNTLLDGGQIYLKDKSALFEVELLKESLKADFLMPTQARAISSAFICKDETLKLLASIEKPLMKLRLSKLFRQNHGLDEAYFRLKLAPNLFLFALGQVLFEKDIKFLSFKVVQKTEDLFEILECDKEVVVLRGFEYILPRVRELIFSKEDKNFARLSYLLSKFKQDAFVMELSKDYEDILLIHKEQNLLKLNLPSDAKALYEEIKSDETGARLLENFAKQFPLLQGEFALKNNFFSLLGLVGKVLKLDSEPKEASLKLLSLADESKMPRGVKIDFRLKEDKSFDYARTVRSVMSFMLAGVETSNIAYGCVESLSLFLRDTYDDLLQKKQAQIALVSGSLFEHKSLLKNTLKHLKHCQTSDVPLYI